MHYGPAAGIGSETLSLSLKRAQAEAAHHCTVTTHGPRRHGRRERRARACPRRSVARCNGHCRHRSTGALTSATLFFTLINRSMRFTRRCGIAITIDIAPPD